MELREITVLVDEPEAGDSRLAVAAELAKRVSSDTQYGTPCIIGIGIVGRDNAALGASTAAHQATDQETLWIPGNELSLAQLCEQRFRRATEGLRAEWRVIGYDALKEMIGYARLTDLVILGQRSSDPGNRGVSFTPEDVIAEAGAPVLIVPRSTTLESVGRHVMVAWNGTRESGRALRDSLVLLRNAKTVTVIDVGYDGRHAAPETRPPDYVARYLARHGITASIDNEPGSERNIVPVLVKRATELNVDLLVAGAFHHSSIRQALIGSMTSELIRLITVPLLLSR